ncbi:hypothetical protein KFK09_021034 [Dendrobium nobile]|uniref:Uncharacterized protein n=1 Tax=Dendrobium nobile TaxID=94219 RepID=A0A8T3AP32_DENNO|nr:hypothetical protein KFK09_021034 [Dendrobium nobile]
MPPFVLTAPEQMCLSHQNTYIVLIAPKQISSDPEQNKFQISDLSSFQISQTLTESHRIQTPYNSLFIAYTDSISIQNKSGQIRNQTKIGQHNGSIRNLHNFS